MEYNRIVSVTGLSGLFELISSKADGGVVRSLEDKTTRFVSNRVHNFSHLESIEIYTIKDNVNLSDVFRAMKDSSEALPPAKASNDELKTYFSKVYPDMDFERVYASDMKKMVKWFEIITKNNIEISSSENSEEAAGTQEKKAPVKNVEPKAASVKSAPARKINTPRKMA